MRQALRKERQEVIERMLKINPMFQPPRDYVRQKPFRKLYIPQKDYPQYNFIGKRMGWGVGVDGLGCKPQPSDINESHTTHPPSTGLIIGPRGATQKDMEKRTNTKISIRGKGAYFFFVRLFA